LFLLRFLLLLLFSCQSVMLDSLLSSFLTNWLVPPYGETSNQIRCMPDQEITVKFDTSKHRNPWKVQIFYTYILDLIVFDERAASVHSDGYFGMDEEQTENFFGILISTRLEIEIRSGIQRIWLEVSPYGGTDQLVRKEDKRISNITLGLTSSFHWEWRFWAHETRLTQLLFIDTYYSKRPCTFFISVWCVDFASIYSV
jgi:hypothetical protein